MTAERPLSIWCYGIGAGRGLDLPTQSAEVDWLGERGFRVNPDTAHHEDIESVVERCAWWEGRRGSLDYEIDGVVVKIDERPLWGQLGAVGREPRWAIAWKFPPTTATTTMNQIVWNVGRTGHLVPFAMLEPVQVGGVTVTIATLHNEEDLARKDVREGDKVIVMRAGDVIPQVVSPNSHARRRARRPKHRRNARPAAPRRSSRRTRSSRSAPTGPAARASPSSTSSTSSAGARWTSRGLARNRRRASSAMA